MTSSCCVYSAAKDDIIDETLKLFRAQVFFKNFEVHAHPSRLSRLQHVTRWAELEPAIDVVHIWMRQIETPADLTLTYLVLFTQQCIQVSLIGVVSRGVVLSLLSARPDKRPSPML